MKNIIFITHAEKKASGGAKIIYNYSQIINNLKNFKSEVLHLKKKKISKIKNSFKKKLGLKISDETGWQLNEVEVVKNFKYKWFEHNVLTKNDLKFDKDKDFVILPEIFSHLAADLLIKNNIKYSIFVQNGYVIASTNNEKKLKDSYNNASFILSYSNDITKCINLKFPKLKAKIIKVSYALNLGKYDTKKKKNLITFMGRKLPQHSYLVLNYLKSYLPSNWLIKNINNMSEKDTYKNLKKSKIFLAFSNFEGLPLPPAEAALAGNYVIGYTGEGGKEYWKKPLFTKIYSGEIVSFVNQIINRIKLLSANCKFPKKKYLLLKNKFSSKNELNSIKNFLRYI